MANNDKSTIPSKDRIVHDAEYYILEARHGAD
jgi:hypothetical protein